jgi:hypothetical protein
MSAVLVGMMFGRFSRVVGSVLSVPVRYVSVVTGLLVISALVVLGSFTMVFRRVLVMFSRLVMVLCSFVCHFGRLSMSSFAGQFSLQQDQYTPLAASVRFGLTQGRTSIQEVLVTTCHWITRHLVLRQPRR